MARKRKQARQQPERLGDPTAWRLQHGPVTSPLRIADPGTGTPIAVRRCVDTIGQMLANGTITAEMHEAASIFHTHFRAASLDPLRARSLMRLPGSTGESVTAHQARARERVARAIVALGGSDSPAGSCIWHVVGCEMSVREWAMHRGWGGRSVPATQAQGMLVAALSALAGHLGLAGGHQRIDFTQIRGSREAW
jgi:hypothetical protein